MKKSSRIAISSPNRFKDWELTLLISIENTCCLVLIILNSILTYSPLRLQLHRMMLINLLSCSRRFESIYILDSFSSSGVKLKSNSLICPSQDEYQLRKYNKHVVPKPNWPITKFLFLLSLNAKFFTKVWYLCSLSLLYDS